MTATCPQCDAPISATRMYAAADVVACPQCDEVIPLSWLMGPDEELLEFVINDPPAGAWFHDDVGHWRIGATTRHLGGFFLVPFTWLFATLTLNNVYGGQFANGEFDPISSLIGVPFLLATLVMGSQAAMTVLGRVDVLVTDTAGKAFVGVGPIGWTRRFDWSEITRIEEDYYSAKGGRVISLVGKVRLKFGSMLTDERRYYLLEGLRSLHERS